MAYILTYRIRYKDRHPVTPLNWEVQLLQKNGSALQVTELYAAENPVSIDRATSDSNAFSPIIGANATISYVYDEGMPHPNTFIKIQEDEWMVVILKNGVVEFKGFVRPDSNTYPLLHPPFAFEINATDYFQVLKATPINLDDNILFLYDYITWGDFFRRTLFTALPYDDIVLNIVFTRRPDSLLPGQTLANGLYLHTDIFYDFEKGPVKCYDALSAFLGLGMRMFYSAGAYWIVRIEDMDQDVFTYLQISPSDLTGVEKTEGNILRQLGTSDPGKDVYYTGRSQRIRVETALKEQEFNYKLKGINRLANFDWRDFNGSSFPGWRVPNPGSGLTLSRIGVGTIADPYRAEMNGSGNPEVGAFIGQTFIVSPGQHIEINIKSYCYYTVGLKMIVSLLSTSSGPEARQFYLSGSKWEQTNLIESDTATITVSPNKKTRFSSFSVTSDPIPGGTGDFYLFFNILGPTPADPDPEDQIPSGTTPYNQIYPTFLRIYDTPYVQINTKITNDGIYSYTPDPEEKTFIDSRDSSISNTIYYKQVDQFKALPDKDWASIKKPSLPKQPIDEIMSRDRLAAANMPVDNLEGTFLSNTLQFHNVVVCEDLNKRFMVLRDKYNTKECLHDLTLVEIFDEGSGSGQYTVTPKTADNG